MDPFLQQLAAYATVGLAGGWLLWRWLRGRRGSACDRCGPASAAAAAPERGVRSAALRVLR